MDLNVSLDARARKAASAMSNGGGDISVASGSNQRRRKANRDSWPFMHAIMLLECFKEVWTKGNMGNLTMAQWTEVSNKVNEYCGISMNEQQCRTKVDNLKKRYKRERMKYASTGHTSPWEFFGVMNKLFGSTTKLATAGASPQPPGTGDGGDETEASDEDDVVVLNNGNDLIFNIPPSRELTSPQSNSLHSFGNSHKLLLEGATDAALDTAADNSIAALADVSSLQDPVSLAAAMSPRKKFGKASKRKRDSLGGQEGYGELLKEVEKDRKSDWHRRWVELAKLDKRRSKGLLRSPQDTVGRSMNFRTAAVTVDGGLMYSDQMDVEDVDDLMEEEEKIKDEVTVKALWEAEQKIEAAAKVLSDTQEEKERLESQLRESKDLLQRRKSQARAQRLTFKKNFIEKLIPSEAIDVSFTKFPYYLSNITREMLTEAVRPHLKQLKRVNELNNHMILLNGPQYSDLYQETLVKAVAHEEGVGVLSLDSIDLAPQDHGDADEDSSDTDSDDESDEVSTSKYQPRKGDRILHKGSRNERQRMGRVVGVSKNIPGKVAVLFDNRSEDTEIEWHYASELESDEVQVTGGEWQAALSALCEIGKSAKPFIVYFPDIQRWLQRAVPVACRKEFVDYVLKQLDKLSNAVVFIATLTSKDDEPIPKVVKWWRKKESKRRIFGGFNNVVDVVAPKEDSDVCRWRHQLYQDKQKLIITRNYDRLQKVLMLHNVTCPDLINLHIADFPLSNSDAESLVGWGINYEYSNSRMDIPNSMLSISADSLDRAVMKLRRIRGAKLAGDDECERIILSAVTRPSDNGVMMDDVGGAEEAKKALREAVILPLTKPHLFVKANLSYPYRGVLLYGPSGTGKTLLAKATAAECSANLITITGGAMDYKWVEEPKAMTAALFSVARRIAPSIIFIDEMESMFGSGETLHKMRYEFLSVWDRFKPVTGEQVVVVAATCRPFDPDDVAIRRFQRRIVVGVGDSLCREKILHVLLSKEDVEEGFDYKQIAEMSEGYSGSDLKNLCVAAAYRPIREFMELEKGKPTYGQVQSNGELRLLSNDDFNQAMQEMNASLPYNSPNVRQWDDHYPIR